MIGKLIRLVLIGLVVGFGLLVVYRRQAVQKMDAAVSQADDALSKYETVYQELKKRKGQADDEVAEAGRALKDARAFRDGLVEKRDKLKRFF